MRFLLPNSRTLLFSALLTLGVAASASAQGFHMIADPSPKPPSVAEAKSRVKKIGETEYQLGEIRFDSKTHVITFPGEINMNEGALEYALVHENGKTHESLLRTKIRAFDLNVVMLLCGFEPHLGQVVAGLSRPTPEMKKEAHKPMAKPGADNLKVHVKWKDDKGEHDQTVQEMVVALTTNKPLTAEHFAYNGSQIYEGSFEADREGSFIALYIDFLALINSVETRNYDDKNWIVNSANTPPIGTPVTIVFTHGS